MQTVFQFTNIQLNGTKTSYLTETISNPTSFPNWTENADPYNTANNRGGITPSPQFQIGDEESRILGSVLRMRINKAPSQSLTIRHMVIDKGMLLEDMYDTVAFSDFAITKHVANSKWITFKPEFRNQPQQKIFHPLENTPGNLEATYYPIAIIFMNVQSPTSDMVLEVEAEHTIEHRLPDSLKHLHNNPSAKTMSSGGGVAQEDSSGARKGGANRESKGGKPSSQPANGRSKILHRQ